MLLKLSFKKLRLQFEPKIEKEFLSNYINSFVFRLGVFLAILLYAIFSVLDPFMLPQTYHIAWLIRFAIVIPGLLLLFIISFFKLFYKIYIFLVFFTIVFTAYGIIAMIFFSHEMEMGYKYYYTGLMLVIMWIGLLSQLKFWYAVLGNILVFVGYFGVAIFKQNMLFGFIANPKFPILLNNGFFFVSSVIISLVGTFTIEKFKRMDFLNRKIIEQEKEKSDKLLLNILPVRVANDLKVKGKSEPRTYSHVTVFFSDIVGFTQMSSSIEPKLLIDELNDLFTAFDNIMQNNSCERIKTIGDAYLAVSGMPVEDENHAYNIAKSALEILNYCKERQKKGVVEWQIRIGIHTGKVVGGIVGVKKYIYDVFGDTVNTASRMESNSESMKINISQSTYLLIKDKFRCIERDPIFVKGKGEMKMYFLESFL